MTTSVSQVPAIAPAGDAGRFLRALASVREWGKDCAAAFRASAAAPRPEGMDRTVLLMFGRD